MAIERFTAGEPVSARKFNNLVCALNNLCATARNLQRGQTLSLGNNDRPRRFVGSCRCGGSGRHCFCACVEYAARRFRLPPFGVAKVGDAFFVAQGVWKSGGRRHIWSGGWFRDSSEFYVFARNDGAIVTSPCKNYDHRFYRLLADLKVHEASIKVRINYEMVCVVLPKQYWAGDICQPTPRWSQGGVFSSCVTREGKLRVHGGMAYIESPLAVAGKRVWATGCRGERTVVDCVCTLRIVQGYYPVDDACLCIPKENLVLMLYYKSCSDPEFENAAGTFAWYWTCIEKARPLRKCDVPVFGFSQGLTTEFLSDPIRGCWIGGGSPVNYSYNGAGTWGMAIPMGLSYKNNGVLCARVAQKIPEFRARPIINFWNARVCLPTCDVYSICGNNCGFTICHEAVRRSGSEYCREHEGLNIQVPYDIKITYCVRGGAEPTSTVYKAPKQNTISETYYTNGNA